jgi:hypothetical protein
MEELKLEPHPERHPSHSISRKSRTSGTFIEMTPDLAMIKLEPKEENDMEPEDIIESDDEQDPMTLNIKRDDSVFEEEDLPCPLAFLAVEIKAEDDIWDDAQAAKEVEMDDATHGEKYRVHLEELNDVGKITWNEHVEIKGGTGRPRKYVNMAEEKLAKQRERNRLRKRRYRASMSQEALARERERNRLSMKKIRASRKNEEIKRQTETDMIHTETSVVPELSDGNDIEKRCKRRKKCKRKPVAALTPQQIERQRERNRIYMRKFRASLSAEELEKRREKDRLQKKRARAIMKHWKQDITFQVTMLGHSA